MTRHQFDSKVHEALQEVRDWKEEQLEHDMDQLEALASLCESPLEQLLLIKFSEVFVADPAGLQGDKHLRGMVVFPEVDRFSIAIRLQHPISINESQYRADFFVTLEDWDWNERKHVQLVKLVVEVDGHDYHERTKEQAKRDKQRDRNMTRSGLTVMRFTGSEVYRDCGSVASEFEQYLLEQAQKLLG
jgi:hypothetical protein